MDSIKKILLFVLLFICISSGLIAQEKSKKEVIEEINKTIWQPFSNAYANLDAKAYLDLNSKNLIRGGSEYVGDFAAYSKNVETFFQQMKAEQSKMDIQFRFIERQSNNQLASERGIYQLTIIQKDGKENKYYGKFHVFLKKENNLWQIVVDYDSNEKNSINEESFKAAYGIDEFEKF